MEEKLTALKRTSELRSSLGRHSESIRDVHAHGGTSALHVAIQKSHFDSAKALLAAGADLFAEDDLGSSRDGILLVPRTAPPYDDSPTV